MLQLEARREALDFMQHLLMRKAMTVDNTDINQVKEFNDLSKEFSKLYFPENFKKTVLPQNEFTDKIKKLETVTNELKKATKIRNYTKK